MNKMFHMHYHKGLDIKSKIKIVAFLKFIFKKRSPNALYQTSIHPSLPWERRKGRLSKAMMMVLMYLREGSNVLIGAWQQFKVGPAISKGYLYINCEDRLSLRLTARAHRPRGPLGTSKSWSIAQTEAFLTLNYCRMGTNTDIIGT